MRLIGRILAIVLVLITPLLVMAASCNLALYNTMSNEQTYRDAFADRSLLNDIRPFAIPALFDAAGKEIESTSGMISMQTVIDTIDIKNWEEVMEEVVSATWMQDRFNQLLRLFTGILEDNYTTLNESVDVEAIQARLQGESGQKTAEALLQAAPACTTEQETLLQTYHDSSSGTFTLCNPQDEDLKAYSLNYLTDWLASLSAQMQSITATQLYDLTQTEARGLHIILKLDEQSSYVMYLCPAALIALIVFFTVRTFKSFGRWIGGTLLLSGIGVLVTLVGVQILFVSIFSEAAKSMTETERLFTQVVVSLMRAGMGGISQSMLLQAGLLILGGFGVFAVASFIRRGDLVPTGEMVFVTEDGKVISSASLPSVPVEPGSTSRKTASSQIKDSSSDSRLSS